MVAVCQKGLIVGCNADRELSWTFAAVPWFKFDHLDKMQETFEPVPEVGSEGRPRIMVAPLTGGPPVVLNSSWRARSWHRIIDSRRPRIGTAIGPAFTFRHWLIIILFTAFNIALHFIYRKRPESKPCEV